MSKSSACYLLKQGPLCRCNQDKLCSPPGGCSQVRPIPLLEENQHIKRRRRLSNDAGRGGQDAVQASSTKNCQSPYVSARKRQGRPLLGMALRTHQTWTSIFQNWRIMDICWFKLLSLWHLVMAAKQKKKHSFSLTVYFFIGLWTPFCSIFTFCSVTQYLTWQMHCHSAGLNRFPRASLSWPLQNELDTASALCPRKPITTVPWSSILNHTTPCEALS